MVDIVFIGNCQAGMLRLLYQKYVIPYAPANTVHIWSNRKLPEASRAVLRKADVIVRQVQDFEAEADLTDMPPDAVTHLIPAVVGGFLWPFGGRAHPLNATGRQDADGPYPGQLGDSYLNGLIAKKIAPEDAVRQYLALDVNSVVNLDRLYRIVMSRQRRMDDQTGFAVADVIEAHFRSESTFLTAYHPDWPIMLHLADVLFRRMNVDSEILARMHRLQTHAITPPTQLPIHPAVAKHFGMSFIQPDQRYQYRNEGTFTFAEWADRYMRFEWNRPINAGMKLAHTGKDDTQALELLEAGLALSPNAAPAWRAMCQVLIRMNRRDEANAALARSLDLDPDNATSHLLAGSLALHGGHVDAAERAYRRSVELDPAQTAAYRALAGVLVRQGNPSEAINAYRLTIELNPRDALAAVQLVRLLREAGQTDTAKSVVTEALARSPDHPGLLKMQANLIAPPPTPTRRGHSTAPAQPAIYPQGNDPSVAAPRLSTISRSDTIPNIVFFGNCQVGMLRNLYDKFVVPHMPARTSHIISYETASDAARRALADADIVVHQAQNFKSAADITGVRPTAMLHRVPVMKGGFLFPHISRPHPLNKGTVHCPTGPFSSGHGDSFLNRQIQEGADPRAAAEAYASLDIASTVDLDRLFRIVMTDQRRLDEATGYDVAGTIERHFRQESLFDTSLHPAWRLLSHVAMILFERMGADRDILYRLGRVQRHPWSPLHQLPVHPMLGRHFGMTWTGPETRYKFLDEGTITFMQWAERYMRYQWNEPLADGIAMARAGQLTSETERRLQQGLNRSPESDLGWHMLARIHLNADRLDEAAAAATRSIALVDTTAHAHHLLSRILERQNLREAAITALRAAIDIDPFDPTYHRSLARLLAEHGHTPEAIAAMREALALNPREPRWAMLLADLQERQGDRQASRRTIENALLLNANHDALRARLGALTMAAEQAAVAS